MNTKLFLPVLLLSAVAITPATANWFSNPFLGINRCVCTAPSPTPEQVRQEKLPPFVLREQESTGTVADAVAPAPKPVARTDRPAPAARNPQNVAAAAPTR